MNLVPLALAIAPGLAIAIYIYWRDRFEREPVGMLARSFLWGMLSVIPAFLFELVWDALGFSYQGNDLQTIFYAYICVGFSEEYAKYMFLKRAMRRQVFSEPYDGITYAVMISMGFATLENIMYLLSSNNTYTTVMMRMFTAVPAHATFAIAMGYYAGLARFRENKRFVYLTMGLWLAIFMHGTYDAFLFFDNKYQIASGAGISLALSIVFSLRALRLHQHISPFNPRNGSLPGENEEGNR